MSERSQALSALRAFFVDPTKAHADALLPHLANDVVVAVHTINASGRSAVVKATQESLFKNVVFGGKWEEPLNDALVTTQVLNLPAQAIASGCRFRFIFGEDLKVEKIEGGWVLPPASLAPAPVALTTAMRTRIDRAEEEGMPVLFAFTTRGGRPEQIYRKTAHTRGSDQLAFWNPRPDGSFLDAIATDARVSAIYRHADTHEMLEMAGRAKLVESEEEARAIYDARSGAAKDGDPDRTGVAVLIDLERVTGLIHSAETGAIERILMVRGAAD